MPKIETRGSDLREGRVNSAETPSHAAWEGAPPVPQGAAKKELKEMVRNLLSSQTVLRLARRWLRTEIMEDDAAAATRERVVIKFLEMLRAHGVRELVVDVFSNGSSGWMRFIFGDCRDVNIFYSELPRYAEYLLMNIARFLNDICQYTHRYADKLPRSVVEFMACSEAYGVNKINVVLRRRRRAGRKAGGGVVEG